MTMKGYILLPWELKPHHQIEVIMRPRAPIFRGLLSTSSNSRRRDISKSFSFLLLSLIYPFLFGVLILPPFFWFYIIIYLFSSIFMLTFNVSFSFCFLLLSLIFSTSSFILHKDKKLFPLKIWNEDRVTIDFFEGSRITLYNFDNIRKPRICSLSEIL